MVEQRTSRTDYTTVMRRNHTWNACSVCAKAGKLFPAMSMDDVGSKFFENIRDFRLDMGLACRVAFYTPN
jgi:hypothetical protein